MLHQMLSGSLPFNADSMASLMFKITNEEAADVRTLRTDIPVALAAVINEALLKEGITRIINGRATAGSLIKDKAYFSQSRKGRRVKYYFFCR